MANLSGVHIPKTSAYFDAYTRLTAVCVLIRHDITRAGVRLIIHEHIVVEATEYITDWL